MGNKRSCIGVHVQNILRHLSMLVAPVRWLIAEFADTSQQQSILNSEANQQLVVSLTKMSYFFTSKCYAIFGKKKEVVLYRLLIN